MSSPRTSGADLDPSDPGLPGLDPLDQDPPSLVPAREPVVTSTTRATDPSWIISGFRISSKRLRVTRSSRSASSSTMIPACRWRAVWWSRSHENR
ncbi:unnamed protein product [Phytophthora fragariaefolia]|uniref:Unnamed protein product n=1 Tax=Phytophthora fragariaefolia TaxID=1490495 RepID=A0A9W6YFE1_9STRA|nr:unnamed protein product [Phytophthora fragariaefolia]